MAAFRLNQKIVTDKAVLDMKSQHSSCQIYW